MSETFGFHLSSDFNFLLISLFLNLPSSSPSPPPFSLSITLLLFLLLLTQRKRWAVWQPSPHRESECVCVPTIRTRTCRLWGYAVGCRGRHVSCVCGRERDITMTTLRAFLSINQGRVHASWNKAFEEGWRETEMEGGCGVSLASGAAAAEIQHSQRLFGSAYLQYTFTHAHTHTHIHHKQSADKHWSSWWIHIILVSLIITSASSLFCCCFAGQGTARVHSLVLVFF